MCYIFGSDRRGLVLSLSLSSFDTFSKNRATVEIIVQLLSNIFALCQVTALCTLINRATRLRFIRTEPSLDDLHFWSHLCTPSMVWRLPFKYFIALFFFHRLHHGSFCFVGWCSLANICLHYSYLECDDSIIPECVTDTRVSFRIRQPNLTTNSDAQRSLYLSSWGHHGRVSLVDSRFCYNC